MSCSASPLLGRWSLARKHRSAKSGSGGRRRRQRSLAFQHLEPKRLLSVTPPADIYDQPGSSWPADVFVAGDTAYFTAYDDEFGRELWRTDGSEGGTVRLGDFTPGAESSNVTSLTSVGDRVYFVSQASSQWGASGTTLWVDAPGTGQIDSLLTDVAPAGWGETLGILGADVFFFRQVPSGNGSHIELWKTDGSTTGTQLVKKFADFYPASTFRAVGGSLYFIASDGVAGEELWKTDGSEAGTVLVKDINPTSGSYPWMMAVVGDTLYFRASKDGQESLWRTDAEDGAVEVINSESGEGIRMPESIHAIDDRLFVTSWNDDRLWRVDAPTSATPQLTRFENVHVAGRSAVVGTTLYFAGDDGVSGVELWRVSGTSEPELVRNIFEPFATDSFSIDDSVPPLTAEAEPNDGPDSANDLRGSFVEVETGVFEATVAGQLDGQNGTGDWYRIFLPAGYQVEVAGDYSGDVIVHDADGGQLSYYAWSYIAREAGIYYVQLRSYWWESSGSEYSATFRVSVADGDSYPYALTAVGDTLFFVAESHDSGTELWRTDPALGAALVADIEPGDRSSFPSGLTDVDGELYFLANGSGELWKATTTGSTTRIATIRDGTDEFAGSGSYGSMAVLNGSLLFAADDGIHGT